MTRRVLLTLSVNRADSIEIDRNLLFEALRSPPKPSTAKASTLTGSVLAKSFYALNGNFHADKSLFNDNITAANASIQSYAELDTVVN